MNCIADMQCTDETAHEFGIKTGNKYVVETIRREVIYAAIVLY